MSIERITYVRIPTEMTNHILDLHVQATKALRRATKQDLGERSEAIRFEALNTTIEQLATVALANGAPSFLEPYSSDSKRINAVLESSNDTVLFKSLNCTKHPSTKVENWLETGYVVVAVNFPHYQGETVLPGTPGVGPPEPQTRWRSKSINYQESIRQRFESQIKAALSNHKTDKTPVCPSGVTNRVLTESLRFNSQSIDGQKSVSVSVQYRDGSMGPDFPFKSLNLIDQTPTEAIELHFTLLSMRHVEIDESVDGAWFRNTRISRRRQAGITDSIAYEISKRQLNLLVQEGPVLIYMYQTGLEPAIMGFYRAVSQVMSANPHSLAVVPKYYIGDDFEPDPGTPWVMM
jgi:hypothetical protein